MHVKALALALPFLLAIGCQACSATPAPKIATEDAIETLREETVALTYKGKVYCSGVWVGPSTILTAAHCTDPDLAGEDGRFGFAMYGDVAPEGIKTQYASLLRRDEVKDLAILTVDFVLPAHPYARIGGTVVSGQKVDIVGHTSGYPFTYTPGWVSGTRKMKGPDAVKGEFVQVWSGAWGGNSGGGAFDEFGRLVGICSFKGPTMTFFVSAPEVRAYLKG